MADFPFQTTQTAVQLVLNGVMDRYPDVRVILSHAGGFLPYASLRFAELARVFNPDAASPDVILASLRRFYFDTALASGPALPTLIAFAGSSRILPHARAQSAAQKCRMHGRTIGPGSLPAGTTKRVCDSCRPRPQLPRRVVPGTYTFADDGHDLSRCASDAREREFSSGLIIRRSWSPGS
jgi:Amidohydrolase